jgi:general secretion pathway protein L
MPAEDRPQALAQGSRLLITGFGCGGVALSEAELPSWQALLQPRVELELPPAVPAESQLAQLAPLLAPARAINLLQGDYRLQDPQQVLWRRWRTPAVLALVLLLLTFASLGFETYQLSRQQAELDRQITELFRIALPETRRIVNPRAQLSQQLDTLRQQHQGPILLRLLEKTVPAFNRQAAVRLSGLRYSGDKRVLTLDLEAANNRSLEQFATALEQDGLRIQPSQPQSRESGSSMQIRIEGIDE